MLQAAFRIELPADAWIAEVSTAFPDATYRLLSGVRTGETALELGEVVAEDPTAAADAVATHPAVTDYERLTATERRSLATYETADTGLYDFVERAAVPPEFPVVVRNGWYEFEFTGTREAFDGLRAGLERSGHAYELRSLSSPEGAGDALLTDRQREVLRRAVRAGYFEVPRGCTLEELAAELDVDPSTVSGVLRRGEDRVLRWFLTGGGP